MRWLYLLAGLLVLVGLLQLLAPGLMWRLHVWNKRVEGIVGLEQTPEWGCARVFTGFWTVLFGLALMLFTCSQVKEGRPETRPSPSPPSLDSIPQEARDALKEAERRAREQHEEPRSEDGR